MFALSLAILSLVDWNLPRILGKSWHKQRLAEELGICCTSEFLQELSSEPFGGFGPEVGGNRGIGRPIEMCPAEWGREGREGRGSWEQAPGEETRRT